MATPMRKPWAEAVRAALRAAREHMAEAEETQFRQYADSTAIYMVPDGYSYVSRYGASLTPT